MVVAVGFDSAGDAVAISLDGGGDVQLVTNGAVMWVGPGDLVAALRRLGVLDGGERPGERSRRVLEAWRRVACGDAERAAYARRHAERSFARTLRGSLRDRYGIVWVVDGDDPSRVRRVFFDGRLSSLTLRRESVEALRGPLLAGDWNREAGRVAMQRLREAALAERREGQG